MIHMLQGLDKYRFNVLIIQRIEHRLTIFSSFYDPQITKVAKLMRNSRLTHV